LGTPLVWTALSILLLTLFLDLLELSFGRIFWFVCTLRFWLYFGLHFGLSCIAAYLIRGAVSDWYMQAFVGTFLGVAVISNTDLKIGGYSLLPAAQLFLSIKAKMFDQAAEDKANAVAKAQLVERLQKLTVTTIESAHSAALIAAGYDALRIKSGVDRARSSCGGDDQCLKRMLIAKLVRVNYDYARQNVEIWEGPDIIDHSF